MDEPMLAFQWIAFSALLLLMAIVAGSMLLPVYIARILNTWAAHRGRRAGQPFRKYAAPRYQPRFARQRTLRDYAPLYDFFGRNGPMELTFQDTLAAKGKPNEWRMVLTQEGIFARKRREGSLSRFDEYALSWDWVRGISLWTFPDHGMRLHLSGIAIHMRMDAKHEGLSDFRHAMAQLEMAASWAFQTPAGKVRARRGPFGRRLRNPYAWGLSPEIPMVADAFSAARRFRAQSTAIDAPDEIPRARPEPDEELRNETARIIRWENQEVRSL